MSSTENTDNYDVDELFERTEICAFLDDQNAIWIRIRGDDVAQDQDVKLVSQIKLRGPMAIKHRGGRKTVVRIFDYPETASSSDKIPHHYSNVRPVAWGLHRI